MPDSHVTRRGFLTASGAIAAGAILNQTARAADPVPSGAPTPVPAPAGVEPIIDIHQHTLYWGRSDAALVHHQKVMGVTHTLLQPSGSQMNTPTTLNGKANGLQAGAGDVETCKSVVALNPGGYSYCANEVPDREGSIKALEKQIKEGAIGIGEQKFHLPCDSKEMQAIYELAAEYDVPVMLHFQHETYNTGYDKFEAMLKKHRKTRFIGHAQMFWGNIDAKLDPKFDYPRGKVTPGGLTDRYMQDYPNLWGDMSAGSGLNALMRDQDHARGFIERHQDRLVYGSDCPDPAGHGPTCTGSQMISAIRRLSPSKTVVRKLLFENAKALYKLHTL